MSFFIVDNMIHRGYHPLKKPTVFTVSGVKKRLSIKSIVFKIRIPDETIKGYLKIILTSSEQTVTLSKKLNNLRDDKILKFNLDKFNAYGDFSVRVVPEYRDPSKYIDFACNETGLCLKIGSDNPIKDIFNIRPLISIITPLYRTPIKYLKETVRSVKRQSYDNWELCLVDDGSNDLELLNYLDTLKNDNRIKVKINKKNKGISLASNEGIKLANGKYICFLDHDDMLDSDALYEVIKAINDKPDLKFIYTDENKVDVNGRYYDFFHKPDWSYDMILSQNYTCHLSVYLKSVIDNIGGFDDKYKGSQDHDLVLKVSENIDEADIHHIPKVLYHWRCHPESTASGIGAKLYTHGAALNAIKDHLKRRKIEATVYPSAPLGSGFNVNYLNNRNKTIQIVVLTRNNPDYLECCIRTVLQSSYEKFYVVIVDHLNTDKKSVSLLKEFRKHPKVSVIQYKDEFNFSRMNNYAVDGKSDAYLFLNDDTEIITKDWIEQLVQHIGLNGVAVSGAKLLYPDGKLQHAGVIMGLGGVAGHSHKYFPNTHNGYFGRPHLIQNLSGVTGACLLIDRVVFEEVGCFEEDLPRAFNDVDLCLKVRSKGYKIVYNPNACLYHFESVSRKRDPEEIRWVSYIRNKWKDLVHYKDPYYNINLKGENFSLKN